MFYQDVFTLFWDQVKESVQEGTFAKVTMAKTVGKPDLRNIFVRPVFSDNGFKVLLKLRYRSKDTIDKEDELTLEDGFLVLKKHLRNPFLSVILFSTKKDVTFKVNNKGIGKITESLPTFNNVTHAKSDDE